MEKKDIPFWAQQLKESFCSGASSQFIIYGNVFDVIHYPSGDTSRHFMSLKKFLEEVMLEGYDAIISYDRGHGITVKKGDRDWTEWISSLNYGDISSINTREPSRALELIDRYILRTLNLQTIKSRENKNFQYKLAVVIDFAQFIVPSGDPVQFASELGSNIVKIISWSKDPVILNSNIATFLITEKLNDLNKLIVENPHASRLEIKLPDESEVLGYIKWLESSMFPQLEKQSDVKIEMLARYLTGLSRIDTRNVIAFALNNNQRIKEGLLKKKKKEMIESECQDLMEFFEPSYNLDMVAGHKEAKEWLRQDAMLIKMGKIHALPMGYLITGRIGTGKTFLVQCWAGELGIPCVVLKNFRDKWVGSTESNLEKIFSILRALGQVVVFVDEADQMTGKRESGEGDSGLSGRVYAMIAREMSNTKNRGKIIWVFATSRPDLLEVDLKRQGRLDIHIPLFPPQTDKEYQELFVSIAKKIGIDIGTGHIISLPKGMVLGGHEIEGIIVRALRIYELEEKQKKPLSDIIKRVIKDITPSANTRKLEYMDLIAVRECTDKRFLTVRFTDMEPEEIEKRIEDLKRFL